MTNETPSEITSNDKSVPFLLLDLLLLYSVFCLLTIFVYNPVIGDASERLTSGFKAEGEALGDVIKVLPYLGEVAEGGKKDIYAECRMDLDKEKDPSLQDLLNAISDSRRCYYKNGAVYKPYSSGLRDAVAFYNDRMEFARQIKSLNMFLLLWDNEDTSPLSY